MDAWMMGGLLASPQDAVPLDAIVLRMLVAWLCGWALGWVYSRSHGALSYSQNFVQAIVILAMVVCMIMGVVGDSLSRAFGLAAALAVVRFRTPVKDARDTTFLFMAVASGMAAGAGQILFAGLTTVLMCGGSLWLSWTDFGARSDAEGLLRFRFAGDETQRTAVNAALKKHSSSFRLSGARSGGAGSPEELVYDLDLRSENAASALLAELTSIESVTAVTLLPRARVGEG